MKMLKTKSAVDPCRLPSIIYKKKDDEEKKMKTKVSETHLLQTLINALYLDV